MTRRVVAWVLAMVVALFVGAAAYPALAQSTGGSFGGGSFGGGGSYSGGGGYSGGGSSFGGGYSSGGSYSGGGGGGGGFSVGGLVFMVVLYIVIVGIKKTQSRSAASSHGAQGWRQVDVSAIRLGIDWRARKGVQARLEELAKSGQTGTKAGLANLLRETVTVLKRTERSWLYANVSNFHPMSAPAAEGIFRLLGTRARAQFRTELVRNADGTMNQTATPEMRAHKNEGEGVVVITLIVAAHREILDVHNINNAADLNRLLDDMAAVANPASLVALEVIWSPAAENDRMSTAELEQNYPDLKKIDESSIAGRVFCSYCQGPFAMELLACPHCGAPAPTPEAPPVQS